MSAPTRSIRGPPALEPVQVVSFLPGPYRIEHYRGRVQAVATCEGADRALSRRRAADLDLRDGAPDGHGGARSSSSIRRRSALRNLVPPEEFPYKIGSGIVWDRPASSNASSAACEGDRLRRRCARKQAEARARRQMVRHRHRVLRRADRHRLAHLGRARHADQHRHRDRDHPHRLDRRGHGGVRRRLARPGAGDDAGAGRRRASRRALRGHPRRAGRQRRGARAAPAPMRAAAPCWRAAPRRLAAESLAREGAQRRLASARGRARRSRRRATDASRSPAPTAR